MIANIMIYIPISQKTENYNTKGTKITEFSKNEQTNIVLSENPIQNGDYISNVYKYSTSFLENCISRPTQNFWQISQYFPNQFSQKDIIISDEVGFAKPAAEFFDTAFITMGRPVKEDVIIIGDSLTSDMTGGIKYGIDTCWYNPSQVQNENNLNITYEITELPELLKITDDAH